MSHYLFEHLKYARKFTLKMIEDIEESKLDVIPQGFNNNIRWNLGHIYTIQEKFAYQFTQDKNIQLPDEFIEMFNIHTKPADWKAAPPSTEQLKAMLEEQSDRILKTHENRLDEKIPSPFTTSRGITLSTLGELLTLSYYHEGEHFSVIKMYKRMLNQ